MTAIRKHVLVLVLLLQMTVLQTSASTTESSSVRIPVVLWDDNGQPISPSSAPRYLVGTLATPRYLVGTLAVQNDIYTNTDGIDESCLNDVQHFTFDFGNPGDTILLSQYCLGCGDDTLDEAVAARCPPSVPECENGTSCWASHPNEYLSLDHYQPINDSNSPEEACKDAGVITLGMPWHDMSDVSVCMACFDGGDHSRYYVQSTPAQHRSLVLIDERYDCKDGSSSAPHLTLPADFRFGAMVRSVPAFDRIWSNVGIGHKSGFMTQMNYTRLKLHLRTDDEDSFVEFNPSLEEVRNAPHVMSASYTAPHQRWHVISAVAIGNEWFIANGDPKFGNDQPFQPPLDFMMDTGNGGISINDESLQEFLADATQGEWMHESGAGLASSFQRLVNTVYTPATAPPLELVLSGIPVTVPGNVWLMNDSGDTIFVKDERYNILGLPFMSAGGFDLVFDDAELIMYVVFEEEEESESDMVVNKKKGIRHPRLVGPSEPVLQA
eukprot:CAMPEP_0194365754 /NCGR_PEP_ID=MMETSP0174-20130528/13782_1 /TAXON_ID=216777 /ORGANISM="Proboscia alata, Strain PI-D3" /LENGTH=494 /DNA_ID=CAMNT_0039140591 /DNA_START=103 /DNA_END=1587 /DNA_ORIENTATION=+